MSYWMQTYTGIKFDLWAPTPSMVCIEDIAHHLSIINRFTGGTKWPYSVAQHSAEVAIEVPCLEALLHDAHEAYIGDISTPLKNLVKGYSNILDEIKSHIDLAIRIKFSLQPFEEVVGLHEADMRMLMTEKKLLMSVSTEDLCVDYEPYPDKYLEKLRCFEAKRYFMEAYASLKG